MFIPHFYFRRMSRPSGTRYCTGTPFDLCADCEQKCDSKQASREGSTSCDPRSSSSGSGFPLPPRRGLAGFRAARSAAITATPSRLLVCFARVFVDTWRVGSSSRHDGFPPSQVGVFPSGCFCGRLALVVFLVAVPEAEISAARSAGHLMCDRWAFVQLTTYLEGGQIGG